MIPGPITTVTTVWTDELHTRLTGSEKISGIKAVPSLAMWHIKSAHPMSYMASPYANRYYITVGVVATHEIAHTRTFYYYY